MEWLDLMNKALDYVEGHLEEEISYDVAAGIACCSICHFQRMFSFITGVPISEYIRRRRMTLAAFELQNTDIKVIDLSLRFGYESPEAFSRAFMKLHGVTPRSARDKGVVLKAYPRISFQISVKGAVEMDYCIKEKDSFEVFGLELNTSVIDGQCYKEIPAFWQECGSNGACEALIERAGKDHNGLIDAGVTYNHNPDGTMNYMIGCVKKAGAETEGYTLLNIPKQTWAVFSTDWKSDEDDATLHDVWQRIYSEWFPTAGYEHADCDFDLEMYFGSRGGQCSAEIWIPVKKQ